MTVERINRNFIYFEILIFIYMLLTSATWFIINMPGQMVIGVMNILLLMSLLPFMHRLKVRQGALKIILTLIFIGIWFAIIRNIGFSVYNVVELLPALYIYLLPYEYKDRLLKFCTKWYAIFLAISLCLYFISLFIYLPPVFGFFNAGDNRGYPPFLNYFFYIRPLYSGADMILRFNGFFIEPGHLAISTIFFLVANRLDFKKTRYMWVLLTAVIVSWSLAGYILLGISWIMFKANGLRNVIVTAFIGFILFIGAQSWNGGDNKLNNLIFARLEYNKERGIEGNNRTNDRTNDIFENTIASGQILTGNPRAVELNIFGAGYKKYLIQYGVISLLLMLTLYRNLRNPNCSKSYGIAFLILVFITWCDCEYLSWFTWILPYTLGTGLFLKNPIIKVDNKIENFFL